MGDSISSHRFWSFFSRRFSCLAVACLAMLGAPAAWGACSGNSTGEEQNNRARAGVWIEDVVEDAVKFERVARKAYEGSPPDATIDRPNYSPFAPARHIMLDRCALEDIAAKGFGQVVSGGGLPRGYDPETGLPVAEFDRPCEKQPPVAVTFEEDFESLFYVARRIAGAMINDPDAKDGGVIAQKMESLRLQYLKPALRRALIRAAIVAELQARMQPKFSDYIAAYDARECVQSYEATADNRLSSSLFADGDTAIENVRNSDLIRNLVGWIQNTAVFRFDPGQSGAAGTVDLLSPAIGLTNPVVTFVNGMQLMFDELEDKRGQAERDASEQLRDELWDAHIGHKDATLELDRTWRPAIQGSRDGLENVLAEIVAAYEQHDGSDEDEDRIVRLVQDYAWNAFFGWTYSGSVRQIYLVNAGLPDSMIDPNRHFRSEINRLKQKYVNLQNSAYAELERLWNIRDTL